MTGLEKKQCVELANEGVSYRELYRRFRPAMTERSFKRRMAEWRRKAEEDQALMNAANIGFSYAPRNATVQVNAAGDVERIWFKNTAEDRIEELLSAIKANIEPVEIEPVAGAERAMLEIPLYDMHFGVATLDHYRPLLNRVVNLIRSKTWEKIVIPVGQDLFHNDSVSRGVTTKGTPIEQVNMTQAVNDAQAFYYTLIDEATKHASEVSVIYSPGNHDRTVGWMFSKILRARYGSIVDDSIRQIKAVWWERCFIGITHGEKGTDTAAGLRGKFTKAFPLLYATADVREIHCGHLHREGESRDEYGIQVRRLCTGGKDDAWTQEEGFVSQKRWMLFEWEPGKLKAIHYV